MSLKKVYDKTNIFASIISGQTPCVKVYETDQVLSFMDVFPQSDGHVLVIHKQAHAANILDIEGTALQNVILEVQRIAVAITEALSPDGIRIIQFNGAPAGQTVFHLHFHVIPVYDGRPDRPHADGSPKDANELRPIADKISAVIN